MFIVLYCCYIRMKEVIQQRVIKMKRAVDEVILPRICDEVV